MSSAFCAICVFSIDKLSRCRYLPLCVMYRYVCCTHVPPRQKPYLIFQARHPACPGGCHRKRQNIRQRCGISFDTVRRFDELSVFLTEKVPQRERTRKSGGNSTPAVEFPPFLARCGADSCCVSGIIRLSVQRLFCVFLIADFPQPAETHPNQKKTEKRASCRNRPVGCTGG